MPEQPSESHRRHPIGVVARRTGLKPDLIRAWERRYGAVEPGRTETRRRFYSDADIERLLLLRRVVSTGRGIGQVAGLSEADLKSLIADEPQERPSPPGPGRAASREAAEPFLGLCLAAAQSLDVHELELQLERASVALSRINLLEKLLVPLMQTIGDLWHRGEIRPIHEHMASAVVRTFLGGMHGAYHLNATAPQLIVTTPARQLHEMGALIAAAAAASEGWQVTYLGPDLPPEEIAAAAVQKAARAVAVSIVYPPDDALLAEDLKKLRRLLPDTVEMIVGGRASGAYTPILQQIGALHVDGLAAFRHELEQLRARPRSSSLDV